MPSLDHEYLLELVRMRPTLATDLVARAGVPLSPFDRARMESGDFTQCTPTEYRADGVVVLEDDNGPVAAIVLEVQRQYKKRKRWSWPVYLASLRARLKRPVLLVVFCEDTATASKCARPIEMGHPGWVLCPVVIGPDLIPEITDIGWALEKPDLAIVSMVVHADGEAGSRILQTLFEAADQRPEELTEYGSLLLTCLPDTMSAKFQEILMTMTIEPRSKLVRDLIAKWRAEGMAQGMAQGMAEGMAEGKAQGKAEGAAQGKAEGEAESILLVLEARGIPVPDEAKTRITECTDLEVLRSWVRKAATAGSVDELLD